MYPATATAVAVLCLASSLAMAQVEVAIEYGYTVFIDSFVPAAWFVTSFPDEIERLDTGAFDSEGGPYWVRSAQKFNVWTRPVDGAVPTCRFFGFGDHLYTPYAAECATLRASPDWTYEGIVFYLKLPDENGNCPPGTTILYRLFNNGHDVNTNPMHRLTTSARTLDAYVRFRQWVPEGDARTSAFACTPTSR